jgi:hypothetical protein
MAIILFDKVPDRVHQVGLTQAGATVKKQRVVCHPRVLRGGQ